MRAVLLFLVISFSTVCAVAGESPREFARRFYAAYQKWPIRGVPVPEHEDMISPYLSIEIIRAFRRVNEHRRLEAKRYDPNNPMKPRWCAEGDVFCDNWEGITRYAIGTAKRFNGRWVVEANLEYIESGTSYPWTDRLILERAGDDWVVADIEYSRGGTLLTSTLEGLAEADIEIPKGVKNRQQK
jgi:hypothetical protein